MEYTLDEFSSFLFKNGVTNFERFLYDSVKEGKKIIDFNANSNNRRLEFQELGEDNYEEKILEFLNIYLESKKDDVVFDSLSLHEGYINQDDNLIINLFKKIINIRSRFEKVSKQKYLLNWKLNSVKLGTKAKYLAKLYYEDIKNDSLKIDETHLIEDEVLEDKSLIGKYNNNLSIEMTDNLQYENTYENDYIEEKNGYQYKEKLENSKMKNSNNSYNPNLRQSKNSENNSKSRSNIEVMENKNQKESKDNSLDIYNKLFNDQKSKEKRMQKIIRNRNKEELRECTFKPIVNSYYWKKRSKSSISGNARRNKFSNEYPIYIKLNNDRIQKENMLNSLYQITEEEMDRNHPFKPLLISKKLGTILRDPFNKRIVKYEIKKNIKFENLKKNIELENQIRNKMNLPSRIQSEALLKEDRSKSIDIDKYQNDKYHRLKQLEKTINEETGVTFNPKINDTSNIKDDLIIRTIKHFHKKNEKINRITKDLEEYNLDFKPKINSYYFDKYGNKTSIVSDVERTKDISIKSGQRLYDYQQLYMNKKLLIKPSDAESYSFKPEISKNTDMILERRRKKLEDFLKNNPEFDYDQNYLTDVNLNEIDFTRNIVENNSLKPRNNNYPEETEFTNLNNIQISNTNNFNLTDEYSSENKSKNNNSNFDRFKEENNLYSYINRINPNYPSNPISRTYPKLSNQNKKYNIDIIKEEFKEGTPVEEESYLNTKEEKYNLPYKEEFMEDNAIYKNSNTVQSISASQSENNSNKCELSGEKIERKENNLLSSKLTFKPKNIAGNNDNDEMQNCSIKESNEDYILNNDVKPFQKKNLKTNHLSHSTTYKSKIPKDKILISNINPNYINNKSSATKDRYEVKKINNSKTSSNSKAKCLYMVESLSDEQLLQLANNYITTDESLKKFQNFNKNTEQIQKDREKTLKEKLESINKLNMLNSSSKDKNKDIDKDKVMTKKLIIDNNLKFVGDGQDYKHINSNQKYNEMNNVGSTKNNKENNEKIRNITNEESTYSKIVENPDLSLRDINNVMKALNYYNNSKISKKK